jgi:dihydrodipicolinate synthase/N-acetylneuraminate lyase
MTRPVYAIPPSFKDDELDINSTCNYLKYLEKNGATRVLTTAGTSQFNLLSLDEIYSLNKCLVDNFSKEKILGLPTLSLKHLIEEIHKLNNLNSTNTKILILFPERYYNDNQIIDFFKQVCKISKYPVYLHGNPLRKGCGGTYEYSNNLLKSLSEIDKFQGIKEEYSSLDLSIKNIQNLNLDIIVAGGSMRRFWTLYPFGATSFLTGIGNFNPKYSEEFYDLFLNKKYDKCLNIIQNVERPLFKAFMEIGWHAAMRESLKEIKFILENRNPFIIINKRDKSKILTALKQILK